MADLQRQRLLQRSMAPISDVSKGKAMSSPSSRSFLRPVGRFMRGAAKTIDFARQASAIADTPESVFEARGTTRDKALRALLNSGL
ncbi:MAG: hypothetical protein NXH91_19245 [Phyllobacteriaceae bacterium]|jgi:hypothetical protein|nr:hypothetical protein [Phyllobacteriaceae bacterium]